MGMRIQTNVHSLIAQRNLTNTTSKLGHSMEKLSSGFRINRSRDDAAGLAITEVMRGKIRGLNQAKRNTNDAVSMLQVAEGAMNEMSNILVRMRELAVQSSTGTLSDRERGYLNREYVQLASEIDRIANTAEFNDNRFFKATEESAHYVIQVGTNASKVEDNEDAIAIDLAGLKFSTQDLGIGKGAEIGPVKGIDETPSRDAIRSKLGVVDDALSRLAEERANIGAMQSRLESTINNLGVSVENLDTAKSRIKDVDIAEETANLAKQRVLAQSGLSVLAQANTMPDMALALLR